MMTPRKGRNIGGNQKGTGYSMRHSGMTLGGMVVGVLAIAACFPVGMASMGRSREQANRARCANNLRQIALAGMMYANVDVRAGAFPRTFYNPTGPVTPTCYTGVNSPKSFSFVKDGKDFPQLRDLKPDTDWSRYVPAVYEDPGVPKENDVSAAMYLILKTQDITPEVFICPSSPGERYMPTDGTEFHSNFPSRLNVTYSYSNPYALAAALKNGWKFNNSLGSDFPLVSDLNPGGPALLTMPFTAGRKQMMVVNSPNHGGDGQNVVYFDAHVEFQQTPYCGAPVATPSMSLPYRDNIYTAGLGGGSTPGGQIVSGAPTDAWDAVMLPIVADGTQPPGAFMGRSDGSGSMTKVFLIGIAVLFVLVLLVVLWIIRRPRKPMSA